MSATPSAGARAPHNPPAEPGPSRTAGPRLFDLLAGLPAVAAGLTLVAALVFARGERSIRERYSQELETLSKQGDFAGSLVCANRLLEMYPNQADLRMFMALLLTKVG